MIVGVLEGFAGPGGFSEAARMLGIPDTVGIEASTDACASAAAAGHRRTQADIRDMNPADFPDAEGWVSGPPCPSFSDAGKRAGIIDYELVLEGITAIADCNSTDLNAPGWARYRNVCAQVRDPRTALVLETLKFALLLPNLRWMVAEQVPSVGFIWENIAAELAATAGIRSCHVIKVRYDDLGLPTRRVRQFLVANRGDDIDLSGLPVRAWWSCGRFEPPTVHLPTAGTSFPRTTMAGVLNWPAGVTIRTRGNRKTPGGNLFSADGPSLGLTEKARSWLREDTGEHALTAAQAGLLQGFPLDHPWRGSRSSQFLQIADTVSPVVGAAVLGAACGVPWEAAVRARLEMLYGVTGQVAAGPEQLDLFEGAAA